VLQKATPHSTSVFRNVIKTKKEPLTWQREREREREGAMLAISQANCSISITEFRSISSFGYTKSARGKVKSESSDRNHCILVPLVFLYRSTIKADILNENKHRHFQRAKSPAVELQAERRIPND